MKTKLAIIIPCYNEEKRLDVTAFKGFLQDNPEIHFYFSNDGSKDGTAKVLTELSENASNAHFFDFTHNQGKAETVRKSLIKIFSTNQYDYIGYFDADCATPLAEINHIHEVVEHREVKMVLCSRVKRLGADIRRKFSRHIIGRLFATAASLILGLPVYDTQCGAKLIHKSVIQTVTKETFTSKWLFDIEIIFRILKSGHREDDFFEHPVSKWEDVGGSKLKSTDFLVAPLELLKIWIRYR